MIDKCFTSSSCEVNDRSLFGCLGCCALDFSLSLLRDLFPVDFTVEMYSEPSKEDSLVVFSADTFRPVVFLDCAAISDIFT